MPKSRQQATKSNCIGTVNWIKKYKYWTTVSLKEGSNINTYKVFDITADLLTKNVKRGERICATCTNNLYSKAGRKYNRLDAFILDTRKTSNANETKVSKNSNTKKKEPLVWIMSGVITNTNNIRDKHSKDEISFCFKSFDRKKVDYIIMPKFLSQSTWFKKGSKVNVEVIEQNRDIKRKNRTLVLLNMWGWNK